MKLKMLSKTLLSNSNGHRNSSLTILCRRFSESFKVEDLQIHKTESPKNPPLNVSQVAFGSVFTDHMLCVDWCQQDGWSSPVIKPLTNLQLHPASCILHYANGLFEGMKAFRSNKNEICMFRPMMNMQRLYEGAKHACLPIFDKDELLKCISHLVYLDRKWVPNQTDTSLYIRPTLIGTESSLGLKRPTKALLYCILCPVGPYFSTGTLKPISLLADPRYVRASKGGFGRFKFGSNYGPTVYIAEQAKKKGCGQTLWLYGKNKHITEAGTMNVFIYWKNKNGENEVVTMGLKEGLVLPGVTRDSVIELLRKENVLVREKNVMIEELREAVLENRVYEVFGTGTACSVSPVNEIVYQNSKLKFNDNQFLMATMLYKKLQEIQYSNVQHEWIYYVCR